MNRPIFVVGSPRSGTSILTWCLGQHSNILAQEESNWLGRFALDMEAAYQSGTQRGERSQLASLGVKREVFFATAGQAINELILGHRHELTRIAREQAMAAPGSPQTMPAFKTERSESDPKQRWVDGTPEYSLYICGLRKLFPEAVFIHLLRDVAAVVRSMLHFSAGGDKPLVENEQQAYEYWLRTVRACLLAERAYGSQVVHRLPYSELGDQPEKAFRSLFDFLGEPFERACLEPLQSRINNSKVPPDFKPADAQTDRRLMDEAQELEQQLLCERPSVDPSAANELEAEFAQRVHHNQNVSSYYRKALTRIATLEKEIARFRPPPSHRRGQWIDWMLRKKTSA